MELPGQAYRRHSRGDCQGVLYRPFGTSGPVVVDITKDAQCGTALFRYERLTSIRSYVPVPAPAEECIAEAVRPINAAQRPLLMAGQGVMLGNAEEELQAFLAKSGIPVASTLLGLSAVPTSSPQYVGMGMHGNYGPNIRNQEMRPAHRRGDAFRRPRDGNPNVSGRMPRYPPEIDPAEIDKMYTPTWRHRRRETDAPLLTQRIRLAAHKAWIRRVPPATKSNTRRSSGSAIRPKAAASAWARSSTPAHAYDNDVGAGDRATADVRSARFRPAAAAAW